MSLDQSFAGKRVLVTGGASGIGRQLVQRFSDAGATVLVLDKSAEAIAQLKQELPNVQADIVDLADWEATRSAVEGLGEIDHLVNNAGFSIGEDFLDITPESVKSQFDVLVHAIINVTQVFAKKLIASGQSGTVVNISSMLARKHIPKQSCYSAAKAAVVSLTRSMAVELGAHGIRVNCILPGAVETPLLKLHQTEESLQKILEGMVIKRLISTNDIADLVLFLLSPLSSMITGQEHCIDGGKSLGM